MMAVQAAMVLGGLASLVFEYGWVGVAGCATLLVLSAISLR